MRSLVRFAPGPTIDLHVHTSMSDGTMTPEELVRFASSLGLRAIAITDHDTLDGIEPAQAVVDELELDFEVVPGVEISAEYNFGILHILGFFVRTDEPDLQKSLNFLRVERRSRVPKILEKLEAQNVFIREEEVKKIATGGAPGRPHLANLMFRKGYVKTIQEAFDRYLKRGACAYVPKVKLPAHKAIQLIIGAGGIPVMAHPYSLNQDDPDRFEEIFLSLIGTGLRGIEAYYPKHTREQTRMYVRLAAKFDLVVTGGTDFHGSNKPGTELGLFPGRPPLSYSILEEMKKRLADL
ncbi:MAG: PHP domain-containing protein [Deltaproteobacteria bacterium]|nr:PHP domain-containing protein [Deltaproteobacteria bacterium]